uniref:Transposase Tc1-like domain-containing protein n=1 Tax=Acanthochromis polyacanthus TaxID=80966 RepID=A0A3Q1EZ78_9TELE
GTGQAQILIMKNRRNTAADLQAEIIVLRSESEKVSKITINRRLKERGLKGRIVTRKPLLKFANIQKCLKFAWEHQHWAVNDWKKLIWTDKSKFEFSG